MKRSTIDMIQCLWCLEHVGRAPRCDRGMKPVRFWLDTLSKHVFFHRRYVKIKQLRCIRCDTEFERQHSEWLRSQRKGQRDFCSRDCMRLTKAEERVDRRRNCKQCHRPFNRIDLRQVFCSRSCSAAFNNEKTPKRQAKPKQPKTPRSKRPVKEYLTQHGIKINSASLKAKLWEADLLPRRCMAVGCQQGPEWNGLPLVLQLDHINGDRYDNRIENLRILCPHCHTQTETWGFKGVVRYKPLSPKGDGTTLRKWNNSGSSPDRGT